MQLDCIIKKGKRMKIYFDIKSFNSVFYNPVPYLRIGVLQLQTL